eukprot:scaffold5929_cov72-Phaeocystis_antarctica.AAC.7
MRAIRYYSQAPRAGARVAPRGAAPARRCSWRHRQLDATRWQAAPRAPAGRHIARGKKVRDDRELAALYVKLIAAIRPVYSGAAKLAKKRAASTARAIAAADEAAGLAGREAGSAWQVSAPLPIWPTLWSTARPVAALPPLENLELRREVRVCLETIVARVGFGVGETALKPCPRLRFLPEVPTQARNAPVAAKGAGSHPG